jgi:hypothetical protein
MLQQCASHACALQNRVTSFTQTIKLVKQTIPEAAQLPGLFLRTDYPICD